MSGGSVNILLARLGMGPVELDQSWDCFESSLQRCQRDSEYYPAFVCVHACTHSLLLCL